MFKEMARNILKEDIQKLEERIQAGDDTIELFQERLAELELALEDVGWTKLSHESDREFSKDALDQINRLARMFWLKNPLIRRAVLTQTQYVFGQGVNWDAADEAVKEVLEDFWYDEKNQAELTGHQARMIKESELQVFGNIFFVLFVDRSRGTVQVRSIPVDEIQDIICNPDDAKEPWYYKRVYTQRRFNLDTGQYETEKKVTYYPDINIPRRKLRNTIGGQPVERDAYVYHVSTNRLSDMKFGVSEVYAAMDWARAYKEFLENWATLTKAYSRFAWKLTGKGGAKARQEAAKKLNTTLGTEQGGGLDRNPAPVTGSVFVANDGTKLEPIRQAGPSVKADDGNKMIHMVSAATGIFYHYLVGDPSTGNLATAKAMERPMEMMFRDRQTLWKSIFENIFWFVIKQSVKAPNGKLTGTVSVDQRTGEETVQLPQGMSDHFAVTFPPLLEHDVREHIQAIIDAATLGGKQLAGTMTLKHVTKLLLNALGEEDVNELLDEMFPDGEDGGSGELAQTAEETMVEAVKELREAVTYLAEKTQQAD